MSTQIRNDFCYNVNGLQVNNTCYNKKTILDFATDGLLRF